MATDSQSPYMESFCWEDEDDSFKADHGTNNLNGKITENNNFCSSQNQCECHQGSKSCRRKKKSNDFFGRSEPACPMIQSGAVDFCCGIPVTTPIVFSELLAHSPSEYALPPPPKVPETQGTPCEEALFYSRYQPEEDVLGERDYSAIAIEQKSRQAREDMVQLAELGGRVYPGINRLLEMITASAKTEIMQAKRRAQRTMNQPLKKPDLRKRRVVSCPRKQISKLPLPEAYPVMIDSFEASIGTEKLPLEYEMLHSYEPYPLVEEYQNLLPKGLKRTMKNRPETYGDFLQANTWQKPPIPYGSGTSIKKSYPKSKGHTIKAPPSYAQCPQMKNFASENGKIYKWPKQQRDMSCPPCHYQPLRNEYGQQPPNYYDDYIENSYLAAQFHELPLSKGEEAFLNFPWDWPESKAQGAYAKNLPGYNMNSQMIANQPIKDQHTQPVTKDSKQQFDLVYRKLFDDAVTALQNSSLGELQGSAPDWGNANCSNYFGYSSPQ
ncbi:hypothetical protein Aperf_G00000124290 [Anoplocephala perfoliata]